LAADLIYDKAGICERRGLNYGSARLPGPHADERSGSILCCAHEDGFALGTEWIGAAPNDVWS